MIFKKFSEESHLKIKDKNKARTNITSTCASCDFSSCPSVSRDILNRCPLSNIFVEYFRQILQNLKKCFQCGRLSRTCSSRRYTLITKCLLRFNDLMLQFVGDVQMILVLQTQLTVNYCKTAISFKTFIPKVSFYLIFLKRTICSEEIVFTRTE